MKILVSYDGTENDTDALALGQLLAGAGGSLALAYVRHAPEPDPEREKAAADQARELLDTGAVWLGDPDVPRHVVISASTPAGLRDLAEREGADLIVFGSEYRTAPGHVQLGTSAQILVEGGPIAVAVAPAGFSSAVPVAVGTIAAVGGTGDPGPGETAASLATQLGAELVARVDQASGLVVIGSKAGTAAGRVTLSAAAQYLLELLLCPALVLPYGVALRFGTNGTTVG
jgi:nucleotide-binding universal stress UspA family protein